MEGEWWQKGSTTKCECSSLNPHTGEEDRINRTRKKVLEILAADQEEYSVVFNSGQRN